MKRFLINAAMMGFTVLAIPAMFVVLVYIMLIIKIDKRHGSDYLSGFPRVIDRMMRKL